MPAAQALEIISSDFGVQVAHRDHIRKHAHFVLRRKIYRCLANGGREAKFFARIESFRQIKVSVAIDTWPRNRRVVSHVRRPSGNRVFALCTFKEPNLHRFDRIEQFRSALCKQVGEAWSCACANQRRAVLGQETLVKTELLRPEGMMDEMGIQVEVMSA